VLNTDPTPTTMTGPNDLYHGDRYYCDMSNASSTMTLDRKVNNIPDRTVMAGPSNLYCSDVSNASGAMTLDHILNDTPNRTAMAGPNDLYSDDIFNVPVATVESSDSVFPQHAPTSSSNSFDSLSTRPSSVSNSPIPELDPIYNNALQKIDRRPTGAILNLLPPLRAVLAINNVARSELETDFLPKYLAHLIASNENKYGRYPRSTDIRLSHLSHVYDGAEKHVFALVVIKNDGTTISVVRKGTEAGCWAEALESWARVVREDGQREARSLCVPRDILGNRLDR
jgi:hypothetical protein